MRSQAAHLASWHSSVADCISLDFGVGYSAQSDLVEPIATFPRTELLLNLPLQAIMECTGYIQKLPDRAASEKMRERMSTFFGTEEWQDLDCGDYKAFMRLYVSQRLEAHYQYIGGILVRNIMRGPPILLALRFQVFQRRRDNERHNEERACGHGGDSPYETPVQDG